MSPSGGACLDPLFEKRERQQSSAAFLFFYFHAFKLMKLCVLRGQIRAIDKQCESSRLLKARNDTR